MWISYVIVVCDFHCLACYGFHGSLTVWGYWSSFLVKEYWYWHDCFINGSYSIVSNILHGLIWCFSIWVYRTVLVITWIVFVPISRHDDGFIYQTMDILMPIIIVLEWRFHSCRDNGVEHCFISRNNLQSMEFLKSSKPGHSKVIGMHLG